MAAAKMGLKSVKKESPKKHSNWFFMFNTSNSAASIEKTASSMTVPFVLATVEWKIRNEKLPEGAFISKEA